MFILNLTPALVLYNIIFLYAQKLKLNESLPLNVERFLRLSGKYSQQEIIEAIVPYCFQGEMYSLPATVADDLRKLVCAKSALVLLPNKDKEPILKVHPWPSWLTRGSPKLVNFFIEFFYGKEMSAWEQGTGTCHLCQ